MRQRILVSSQIARGPGPDQVRIQVSRVTRDQGT
jgi:hypothetical protein